MKKFVFNLFLIVMIICIVCIGIFKTRAFQSRNVWNNKDNSQNQENSSIIEEKVVEENNEKTKYVMGEDMEFGPITYRVNNVKTSKEALDFPAPVNWSFLYTFNSDGTLVDKNSYIIVNIMIKNNKSEVLKFYLNTINLVVVNDLETRNQDYSECLSVGKFENFRRKDFFKVELEPLKEYNYDLVFIAPDSSITNNDGTLIIDRQEIFSPEESQDKKRYIDIKFIN